MHPGHDCMVVGFTTTCAIQGRIQDFKLGGLFNATFNNISVILWRSVLLGEETGGPGEKHQPAASH
jgi:hypothetical protein